MLVPSSRPSPYQIIFVLGEAGLMAVGTALAVYIRLGGASEILTWKYSWHRILLVPVILQATFYYFDLYNFRVTRPFIWTLATVAQAMAVGTMALTVVYYIVPLLFLGRGVMILSFFVILSLVLIWRFGYGWALKQRLFSTKVLFLGAGSLADAILEELVSRSDNVYQVVCLVDLQGGEEPGEGGSPKSPDLMESWARLLRADYRDDAGELLGLVRYYDADMVVVATDEKRGRLPLIELLRCRMQGLPIVSGEDFYESIAGRILANHVRPSWLVFSPSGFTSGPARAFSKRSFDLFFSALGLILSSPLALLTAVAIRLDSKGPAIYQQERAGQYGRSFVVYKFRSMIVEAEDESGPVWSPENDPRVTRVGRIIRSLRLDEIPQMWNVLKGDMSFVGPRPERPHFVKSLEEKLPFYAERHNMKPGLTGWAQICFPYGASEAAALEKLNYDLYYIKHSSLTMDIMILVQTVKILLFGGGGR
ncbi:MAG: TIGR03013 family PEP-CTERM/XrtA system glycosyltransferase [Desulfarculaceae bacterium]|jgi:sugar transferase (PEP-CTERM system associated)